MARLTAIAAAILLGLGASARAQVDRWAADIAEGSARFRIPQAWIRRVMEAESGGRTGIGGAPVVSRAGAMGLMQLMPRTWLELRSLYGLGTDPFDPHDNIIAGTAYLRAMYDRFGYPGLFAAYNSGPDRYAAYLSSGAPLPAETVAYVAKVERPLKAPQERPGKAIAPPASDGNRGLFAIRSDASRGRGSAARGQLFALVRQN